MSGTMSQQPPAPVSRNGRDAGAEQRLAPAHAASPQQPAAQLLTIARAVYETVWAALKKLLETIRNQISHLTLAIGERNRINAHATTS